MLRTSRNDHDVARAADSLFGSEAELHLAHEHPNDLLICVTVRLDMDAGPNAPPHDHPLVTRENAAADIFADLLFGQGGEPAEAQQSLPKSGSLLLPRRRRKRESSELRSHFGRLGQLKEMKTMTAYLIADVKVTDDGWVPAYAASVHDIVHKHGGKYLSRSGNVKTLEGKPLDTTLIALLQFPSAEAAEAFVADPEYAPYAAARQGGSDSRFQLIDDTDLAGTIPYLPKG
jgi:uncharacterized protein (DUF1330 family)